MIPNKFEQLKLINQHLNDSAAIDCTCPDWWFPADRRDILKKLPHNFLGIVAHYHSCNKYFKDKNG